MHNDFHQTKSIFKLFDGLETPGMSEVFEVDVAKTEPVPVTNGHAEGGMSNGTAVGQPNGHANGAAHSNGV